MPKKTARKISKKISQKSIEAANPKMRNLMLDLADDEDNMPRTSSTQKQSFVQSKTSISPNSLIEFEAEEDWGDEKSFEDQDHQYIEEELACQRP